MTARRLIDALVLLLLIALTVLLGAFHGFVGWHKAFSPYEELVKHTAWTIHVPIWLGKVVGWVEMALTGGLFTALVRPALAQVGTVVCIAFIVLEVISTAMHYFTRDGASLGQNGLSIALTGLLAALYARRLQR